MILAAGLTPVWQQVLEFDSCTVGEVNRARNVQWCASGKVINAGIALHYLGGPAKTISMIGGSTGESIRNEFEELEIPARWIETETPTRVCTTILDRKTDQTTELVENSGSISESELDAFCSAFAEEGEQAEIAVFSGSLPDKTPSKFFRDLLKQFQGKAVLDIRGPELLQALNEEPFLVKPNREELSRTLRTVLKTDQDLLFGMREANCRGAKWVVVSQGADAVWMSSEQEAYRFVIPKADVVNPIGCGDCLAAGIAWGISQEMEPVEAVRLGIAAAMDNLGKLLPARLNRDGLLTAFKQIDVVTV